MVSLKDVADRAEVSVATASLVLSDKDSGRVSKKTRRRVKTTASELGYIGNAAARTLRTKETKTIGFLSDRIASTPYAVKLIEAANRVALEADQLLLLINTEGSRRTEERAVDVLAEQGVTKTIIASMFHREVDVPKKLGPNVVVLDGFNADPAVPSIVPDETQGVEGVMQVLLDAGHTRIGYLGEVDREGVAATMRKSAYKEILSREGIATDPKLIVETKTKKDQAVANAEKLLKEGKPTAVFCFNDIRAEALYQAARNLGMRIPEDLSVVGFDNQELIAPLLNPPLTTVALPHKEMAEWAVRQVLNGNGDTPPSGGYPVRQECRIVVRDSVGPVRQ